MSSATTNEQAAKVGALNGVRVLDFSRILAGPFCSMMLGDMGADIIKVEAPNGGDGTRQWGPPWHGTGEDAQSAYFVCVNRNKRSLTLNLRSEQGRQIARDLAAKSDIVLENFKRGQMARFGLGYEDLHAINPRLVYCSVTGFGQDGPYADRPGYDFVIQAMSGLMSITGPAAGEPYKIGVAISDVLAGLFASNAILAALRHSERTGQGQYIDTSLLDTQIASLVNVASNFLVSGESPARYGNEHPNIVPYQAFQAADRAFALAVGNDGQFTRLCALLEQPELSADPRFATNPARVANREALIEILQVAFSSRAANEWVDLLLGQGIPAGPINDIPTMIDDPHVQARGLVHSLDGLCLVGPPVKFSETPGVVNRRPPDLGEHTEEILRELLGLDAATVAQLRESDVV